MTPTTSLSGMIYRVQAGTCYRQPICQIQSLYLIYAPYEDMKSGAKCRKWGGLRWSGVTQGYR